MRNTIKEVFYWLTKKLSFAATGLTNFCDPITIILILVDDYRKNDSEEFWAKQKLAEVSFSLLK